MIPYKSSSESADLQIQPDILWFKRLSIQDIN